MEAKVYNLTKHFLNGLFAENISQGDSKWGVPKTTAPIVRLAGKFEQAALHYRHPTAFGALPKELTRDQATALGLPPPTFVVGGEDTGLNVAHRPAFPQGKPNQVHCSTAIGGY